MSKITVKEFIIFYIKKKLANNGTYTIIRNSELQTKVPEFIKAYYPNLYKGLSPETVAREWRRLREDNNIFSKYNIKVQKLQDSKSKEDKYEISIL